MVTVKRLTITRDDWMFNVVVAEDAAIRRRTNMADYTGIDLTDYPAPIDTYYGARYVALNEAMAKRHIQQNERDAMD